MPLSNERRFYLIRKKPELQNNKEIFPDGEIINNSALHDDLGDDINIYTKYWNMLKVED